MHIDLIDITRRALISGGCDEKIIETLDPHAPIELHFSAQPSLRVALVEDVVVRLDAQLNPYADSNLGRAANQLFDLSTEPAPWSINHSVSLLNMDGLLFLTGIVSEKALRTPEDFMAAIDDFYGRLTDAHEVLAS